ncbi:MAG: hypothetical protein KDK41_11955 [Leptospiraceae bacterium]|nr:hypothetical protein [Leptospiraceae bacterium]
MFEPGDIIPEAASFSNFKLNLFGRSIIQFKEFGISYEKEVELKYGKDGEPVSYVVKKYKRDVNATLQLGELKHFIQQATPFGGDLLKLPPQPIVGESESEEGNFKIVCPAAMITKFEAKFKEGEDDMEVPLGLQLISYPIITWT